jgi:integrase
MPTGAVVARNGGYTAVYDEPRPDGKRRQRWKSGFKSRKAAQEYLREQLNKIDRHDYTTPTNLTVKQYLVERWLPSLNVRPTTLDFYARHVHGHIAPLLGGYRLTALRPERIEEWHGELRAKGLSPRSVRHIHGTLRTALGKAVKWDLLARNPADADRVDLPAIPAIEELREDAPVWSPLQLRRFLAGVRDDPLFAAWRLLATTGMRRGEVLGLRWSDVDLDAGTIAVRSALVVVNYQVQTSEPKTRKGRRRFSVDEETVSSLRTHRAAQAAERLLIGQGWHDSDLVFTAPGGDPIHPQRFSDWFQQHIARLGLPRIRLHDVRHSYITAGLAAGIDTKIMAERVGHADPAFTAKVYQHVLKEMDETAAKRVASVIDGAS